MRIFSLVPANWHKSMEAESTYLFIWSPEEVMWCQRIDHLKSLCEMQLGVNLSNKHINTKHFESIDKNCFDPFPVEVWLSPAIRTAAEKSAKKQTPS